MRDIVEYAELTLGAADGVNEDAVAHWRYGDDLVLAMDHDNLDNLSGPGGVSPRVMLFRDFDPVEPGGDVPDPYYGGDAGFEEVLSMVERTSDNLVVALKAQLG